MTKFHKGDFVRVHAKKFDGERDEEGRLFSEKWEQMGTGNGVTVQSVMYTQKRADSHRIIELSMMRVR